MSKRVALTTADRLGVPWLVEAAQEGPVVLTSSSTPRAVVMSTSDAEELTAKVRAATQRIVDSFTQRSKGEKPGSR